LAGSVIKELPFSAQPLHREELESAVKDIADNFFLVRSLQHAHDVAHAVSRQDYRRLEDLLLMPPSRSFEKEQKDAVELGRNVFEAVTTGAGRALKPRSRELAPLDLTFADNTILVVGAHSGMGKSSLIEQILLDLTQQGAMALDISLELDDKTKSYRYLQHLGGVGLSPKAFQEGTVKPTTLLPVLDQFMWLQRPHGGQPGSPRRLKVDGSVDSLPQVIAAINAFVEEHRLYEQQCLTAGLPHPGPPVVSVDFLQQVSAPHLPEVYARMNEVSERLYTLAKTRKIAMIWASQLRKPDRMALSRARTIEEELALLTINDFEGTPRIGNLAHTALFLHEPKETYRRHGHVKVYAHMPKVRAGVKRTLEGLFTGSYMNFDFDEISIRSKL
jgi:hypothetical protein